MRQHLLTTLQVTIALLLIATRPAGAQQTRDQQATSNAVPRESDGRPSFGPLPGHSGGWMPRGLSHTLWDLDVMKWDPSHPDAELFVPDGFPGKLKFSQIPFQPWARALTLY